MPRGVYHAHKQFCLHSAEDGLCVSSRPRQHVEGIFQHQGHKMCRLNVFKICIFSIGSFLCRCDLMWLILCGATVAVRQRPLQLADGSVVTAWWCNVFACGGMSVHPGPERTCDDNMGIKTSEHWPALFGLSILGCCRNTVVQYDSTEEEKSYLNCRLKVGNVHFCKLRYVEALHFFVLQLGFL